MSDTAALPRQLTDDDKAEIRATYEALQNGIPGFRKRGAQMHMIGAVSRALAHDGGVAVIEAGTGTGKSLGYLTAGLTLAMRHQRTLLISTGTIALQEQLVNRDIPLFLKATKIDAHVCIAKGRQRYACSRNLNELLSGTAKQAEMLFGDLDAGTWPRPPQPGEVDNLRKLAEQLTSRQWSGDLDTLPHPVADDLKSAITTTAGACENSRCTYFSECAFVRARSSLDGANIIVANHALLLADLALPNEDGEYGGVLLSDPGKTLYVVDEGHHLPPIARDSTAAVAHPSAFGKRLAKLRNVARAAYQATNKRQLANHDLEDGLRLIADLDTELQQLSGRIAQEWAPERVDKDDEPKWVAPMGVLPDDWRNMAASIANLCATLMRWFAGMRRAIHDAQGMRPNMQQALSKELGDAHERMSNAADLFALWGRASDGGPPIARWVTLAPRDSSPVLHACGVSSADFLRDHLLDRAAGVVVTSATISAGGDFTAFARDLGMPERAETLALPSPFNLHEQGTLRIPAFRSLPGDREAHARETADWLAKNLDWSAGNLVVFTARSRMEATFNALPASCQAQVRMQNTAPKATLVAAHCAAIGAGEGSTLFGLASMGEGLDLPGKLCTRVVIPSLPFQVPSDPVAQTHAQWLESRGGNSFSEVSVPDAIRVLTQYCGRLIRHEDDVGEIAILDRRLADKSYGRKMLKALPPFRVVVEST